MQRSRNALVGSRVARRLLVTFLASALVPIVVISAVALDQVSRQLKEQSELRMRRGAKSAGMALIGHIQSATESLTAIAAELAPTEERAPSHIDAISRRRALRFFTTVTRIDPDGSATPILGPEIATPAGEIEAGWNGRPRIVTHRDSTGDLIAAVHLRIDPVRPEKGHLAARLRLETIRTQIEEGPLPPLGRFCVLDDAGSALVCSESLTAADVDALSRPGIEDKYGGLQWHIRGEEYFAARWDIFLEGLYDAGSWALVLAEPVESVLAPITLFRRVFTSMAIVCLGLASLLAIRRLRRVLSPIEDLRQQAQVIGAGDFSARVELETRDEFEDLANSFNTMAQRLEDQFSKLEKMVEIDRSILSRIDVEEIVHCMLVGIRELYPCDIAAVTLTDPELCRDGGALLVRLDNAGGVIVRIDCPSPPRLDLVLRSQREVWQPLDGSEPAGLEFLSAEGMKGCRLVPIRCDGRLAGAIILAHRQAEPMDSKSLIYAMQIAEQTSVAVQNAKSLEKNRVLAYYDDLTGLPNRLMFKERLEQALISADRRGGRIAVCLLDLDDFKRINDTLGHSPGDELLRAVGSRISSIVRAGSVARLGGDEFTILLTDFSRPDTPATIVRKVLSELTRPFQINGQHLVITASIGIAVHPEDGLELDTLLKNADSAMYHAKEQGKNNYQFYTHGMNASALERLRLESDLRRALANEEFQVFYQPIVDIETLEIVGAEALMRWQCPDRGLIAPGEFIAVAEETGLIVPIGDWVLRSATRDAADWRAAGLGELDIAVNLSARQLRDPGCLQSIVKAVDESGLRPGQLIIELTETMLMDTDERTMALFSELRRLGIRLSIDDFGTGYSSLAYLKHLPVDCLKIDRTFIRDITRSSDDAVISKTIVAMAQSLALDVVAEGVETEEQLAFLRDIGGICAQGYLFGAPAPKDEFDKLLRQRDKALS